MNSELIALAEAKIAYSFNELSDQAKQYARQIYVDDGEVLPDEWWEPCFDIFVECAKCLGIEIIASRVSSHNGSRQEYLIHFSGFSSQGDGACFVGFYRSRPDACAAIAEYAPEDKTLKDLAERLTTLQVATKMTWGDQLGASIGRGDHRYSHALTMIINVYSESDIRPEVSDNVALDEEKELKKILIAFANWMYAQLEQNHDWHFSHENIDEQLSDKTFDESGSII